MIVNKDLIKLLGAEQALMFCELASEHNYFEKNGLLCDDGYFYSTASNIEDNIGFNTYKQEKLMESLLKSNLIEKKRKGLPAKNHYRINEELLSEILGNKFLKNSETCLPVFENTNMRNVNSNNTNSNKNSNKRTAYGEYKNVYLTDDQFVKLKELFPNDWSERIENLSEYCASKGRVYKDYLATIRQWARKEGNKPLAKQDKPKYDPDNDPMNEIFDDYNKRHKVYDY